MRQYLPASECSIVSERRIGGRDVLSLLRHEYGKDRFLEADKGERAHDAS